MPNLAISEFTNLQTVQDFINHRYLPNLPLKCTRLTHLSSLNYIRVTYTCLNACA